MTRALSVWAVPEPLVSIASEPPSFNAPTVSTDSPAPDRRDISLAQNVLAFRRSFPDRWAEYLRETYRTAYAVERAFGIDSKTARDWVSGKRDPSGSFVATVIARDPNAIAILGRTA